MPPLWNYVRACVVTPMFDFSCSRFVVGLTVGLPRDGLVFRSSCLLS